MLLDTPVLAAVASPRRREILRLVWDREMAAGDIPAAMPDISFGAVSLQLRALSDAGLGGCRPQAQHRLYRTRAGSRGAGSFGFVVPDCLGQPGRELWLQASARRWELVPVVIQDPIWEQTFPSIGPVVTPVADPRDGAVLEVRFSRSEARAERARRERARSELLAVFASLGADPVLLDRSDQDSVQRSFLEWAERRRRALRSRR